MNEGLFATSTPSRTSNRPTNTIFSCALSPINSDNRGSDTNNNVGNKKRKRMSNNKSKKVKEKERKSQPVWTVGLETRKCTKTEEQTHQQLHRRLKLSGNKSKNSRK